MRTHVSKKQSSQNKTETANANKTQNSNGSTLQFVDNRADAVFQRKVSDMANNRFGTAPNLSTSSLPIQLALNTKATAFDQSTTVPKSGFFSSEKRLTSVISALEAYESKIGSAEDEFTGLQNILKACDSPPKNATLEQRSALVNLKFEVCHEARTLITPVAKYRMGGNNPSENTYKGVLQGNNFSIFGISNHDYEQKVKAIMVSKSNVDGAFTTFLGSKPSLGSSDTAFLAKFKKHILDSGSYVTKEALTDITPRVNSEFKKLTARKADRDKLSGMLDVSDTFDIFDMGGPNRVSSAEFEKILKIYTRIREGNSGISIVNKTRDGQNIEDNKMNALEFDTFKTGVLNDISKILQTPVGRKVLTLLDAGGKTTTDTYHIANAKTKEMAAHRSNDNTKATDGTGSGATVTYQPGQEMADPLPSTSDTVLLHEMIHAYHSAQGTKIDNTQKVGVGDVDLLSLNDVGVNKEEYATVGLGTHKDDEVTENKYRASHKILAGTNVALSNKYNRRTSYNNP